MITNVFIILHFDLQCPSTRYAIQHIWEKFGVTIRHLDSLVQGIVYCLVGLP